MFGQTFQPADIPVVGLLILLEGLLSADNALVLAILVKHLKPSEQKKALVYGLAGAFVFRLAAILLAGYIIQLWWLQAIGAAYLFFICFKHWMPRGDDGKTDGIQAGFWKTVLLVELTDIAFAIDSIVAAVAMVSGQDKIWVVYLGAMIGIVLLRIAAGFFVTLLDRYPRLEHLAYGLIAWVALKLTLMSGHNMTKAMPDLLPFEIHEMDKGVFWIGMGLILTVGTLFALANGKRRDA